MHYDGPTYRPPTEQYTPLLQVTVGCSHNKCAFCSMYKKVEFRMSPEHEIIEDLQQMAAYKDKIDRIFLLNGDPFVLSTDKLLRIAELVHEFLPKVQTITCYCSFADLRNKSFEDLCALRKAGYNQMYIGIETAYEPALKFINKGYTVPEAEMLLERIEKAGMSYCALLMCGIAGRGKSKENVEATAKLVNRFKPMIISLLSTAVCPGTPLEEMRDRGEFVELTEREQIDEEITLLEALDVDGSCFFFGSHPYNLVPVSGYMSQRDEMIAALREGIKEYDDEFLDSVWFRGGI